MPKGSIPVIGAGLLALVMFSAAMPALSAVVYIAEDTPESAVTPVFSKDVVPGETVNIEVGIASLAVTSDVSVDANVGEPATVEQSAEVHTPASPGARSI